MTLDYLRIPIAVLRLPDLNLREKLLLGLIISFNSNGLKMNNHSLGEILDVGSSQVSRLFTDLQSKNYIQIKNAQSRHRQVYFAQNSKVNDILLCAKQQSRRILLSDSEPSTLRATANITKVTKEHSLNKERVCTHFQKPTSSEVAEYAKTIDYLLDGEYFCDFYEARGWAVGRSLMRDWRAAVRTWKQREGSQNGNRTDKAGNHNARLNPVARVGEFIR